MSGTGVRGVDHFVMDDEAGQSEMSLKKALIDKLNSGGEIIIEQTPDDNELVVKDSNDMSGFTEEQLEAIRQVRAELEEKRKLNDAGSQTNEEAKKDDKQDAKPVPERSSGSRYLKYAVAAAIIAGGAMFWYSRRNKKKG